MIRLLIPLLLMVSTLTGCTGSRPSTIAARPAARGASAPMPALGQESRPTHAEGGGLTGLPTPLPLLGLGAALGVSRAIRRRYRG